mmetsp:Transcript_8764/g.6507  ORF Transcript_8764/g.6507 Transcript_8764/m.6507 type:complete len:87 (-) Transcript_8764:120-380(-)
MLKSGDSVMLMNRQTNGYLVFDMSDRITSHDEAYACTSTDKDIGPVARGVFIVKREDGKEGPICYGDKVRFESNLYIYQKSMYLYS